MYLLSRTLGVIVNSFRSTKSIGYSLLTLVSRSFSFSHTYNAGTIAVRLTTASTSWWPGRQQTCTAGHCVETTRWRGASGGELKAEEEGEESDRAPNALRGCSSAKRVRRKGLQTSDVALRRTKRGCTPPRQIGQTQYARIMQRPRPTRASQQTRCMEVPTWRIRVTLTSLNGHVLKGDSACFSTAGAGEYVEHLGQQRTQLIGPIQKHVVLFLISTSASHSRSFLSSPTVVDHYPTAGNSVSFSSVLQPVRLQARPQR